VSAEAVAQEPVSEVQRGVDEVRQMLAVASSSPVVEVARDDSGFPDVIEAVRVVSSVESASSDAASDGALAASKKSFLDLYAEVKKNADA
jgi:hypothetical protein